jgi:hypothetical protein
MTATLVETPGAQSFRAVLHDDGLLEIIDTRHGWYGWKFESVHGKILGLVDRDSDAPVMTMILKDQRTVFVEPQRLSGRSKWLFDTDTMSGVVTLDTGLTTEVSYFVGRGLPGLEILYNGD